MKRASENKRQFNVGIPSRMLHDAHPRGAVRVARAAAEMLLSRTDLNLIAISEPRFSGMDIIFQSWSLHDWLAKHPLTAKKPAGDLIRRVFSYVKERTEHHKETLKQIAGLLRLDGAAQRIFRRYFSPRNRSHSGSGSVRHDTQYTSIRQLDAILSFECYDAIWDWPTDIYPCAMVGMFHDAIPFRITENIDRSADEYFRAVGRMASKADLVLCNSLASQRDFEAFFPNAREKTKLTYLGHDRDRFIDSPNSASKKLQSIKSLPGKIVAMVGAVEDRKNQAGVLRACRYLASLHSEQKITLLIIGDLSNSHSLNELEYAARKHVDIHYIGYVPDAELSALLRMCDAFLFPSLWEGFGIPILEAMTAGVPVVCSNVSSMPEVAGPWGFYCDPYDPKSIATAIIRALSLTGDARKAWTESARDWAASFTWARMADQIASSLVAILDSSSNKTAQRELCTPFAA